MFAESVPVIPLVCGSVKSVSLSFARTSGTTLKKICTLLYTVTFYGLSALFGGRRDRERGGGVLSMWASPGVWDSFLLCVCHKLVHTYARSCACACVRAHRQRERERETTNMLDHERVWERSKQCVCVCVCVYQRRRMERRALTTGTLSRR